MNGSSASLSRKLLDDNLRKLSPNEGLLALVGEGEPSGKELLEVRLADGEGGGEAKKDCEVEGFEMAQRISIVTTH